MGQRIQQRFDKDDYDQQSGWTRKLSLDNLKFNQRLRSFEKRREDKRGGSLPQSQQVGEVSIQYKSYTRWWMEWNREIDRQSWQRSKDKESWLSRATNLTDMLASQIHFIAIKDLIRKRPTLVLRQSKKMPKNISKPRFHDILSCSQRCKGWLASYPDL